MQRAGIEEHFCTGKQRGQQADRQPKGVEQRQRRHKTVVGCKVGNGFNLLDVGQKTFMTMHDPFRVAFGTGGEEDNRRIFRLLFDLRQFRRQQMAEDPQLIAGRNVAFQVFKKDPTHLSKLLRQMPEFAFIKEGTGGKNRLDFRGANRATQPFNPGGVVHHRRNTPAGNSAKNDRRADAGVG